MNAPRIPRVLAIGLDGAEISLMDRWAGDGTLPELAGLRQAGVHTRLRSSAEWLAGSVWPSFYTGQGPEDHGFYQFLQWRADRMRLTRPGHSWLRPEPFWRSLNGSGLRGVALDVPMTPPPVPFQGVEISGLATHDQLAPPSSYPRHRLADAQRNHRVPPLPEETYGIGAPPAPAAIRDEAVSATAGVMRVAEDMIARDPWNLFLVCLGAPHRAGHLLWTPSGDTGAEPSSALRDIYRACDEAVGRLVRAAGPETTVIVFSLHGMGPNTSRADVLPALLDRVLGNGPAPSPAPSLAAPSRPSPPAAALTALKRIIKPCLPRAVRERITTHARLGRRDWTEVDAFGLVADLQGYIRINLRGRERRGRVKPDEADALADRIRRGLMTFTDADTGRPVALRIARREEVFPAGARAHDLPDLMVDWDPTPSNAHRLLISPDFGRVAWPTPGAWPDGRSGNHRPLGFCLAVGPSVRRTTPATGDILDLAPTILALLGQPARAGMRGRVLEWAAP